MKFVETDPSLEKDLPVQAFPETSASDGGDICQVLELHPESINQVHFPQPETLAALTDLFKAYGDPNRLKIIMALSQAELCVCDLCALVEMNQSAVSHQLRFLRNIKIVKNRRQGKSIFYSLDDQHVIQILGQGLEHVQHNQNI